MTTVDSLSAYVYCQFAIISFDVCVHMCMDRFNVCVRMYNVDVAYVPASHTYVGYALSISENFRFQKLTETQFHCAPTRHISKH